LSCSLSQLPPDDERAFWRASQTQRRVLALDICGLVTGLLVNLLFVRFFLQERSRPMSHTGFFPMAALSMQAAQLGLLYLAQPVYLRHRDECQLVQRATRLLQNFTVYLWLPMDEVTPWLNKSINNDWHRLLLFLLLNPISTLLNSINHSLQFRHQVGCLMAAPRRQRQRQRQLSWPLPGAVQCGAHSWPAGR
jgi:hypothetical protein